MFVYIVMLDDYEAGYPRAIYDNPDDAVALAKKLNDGGVYCHYEVLKYPLNLIDECETVFETAAEARKAKVEALSQLKPDYSITF